MPNNNDDNFDIFDLSIDDINKMFNDIVHKLIIHVDNVFLAGYTI